jgi:hypothetical protein
MSVEAFGVVLTIGDGSSRAPTFCGSWRAARMDQVSTQESVFVAVASIMEEAIKRGEWDKARVCLSILEVIAAKREGRRP